MTVPLPPLPPTFGGADSAARPAGRSVLDVLAEEHRRVAALCAQLTDDSTPASQRRQVADVVVATLARHLSAEEQYLYPSVRAAVPDGDRLAVREIAEDHALLLSLRELSGTSPADPEFDRLAGAVATQFRRHADAAAAELLPLLAQMASVEELVRLGNRIETAEEAAPTRPHPSTPATPPWNKVVDPALGVVDKLRDAVAGRVTYAKDL